VTPYYDDGQCVIYHGDCREVIDDLEFDVVVTDPPYGIQYNPDNHEPVEGDHDTELAAWIVQFDVPMVVTGANHYHHALPTTGSWSCWDKRVHGNADKMFGSPFELIWASGADRPGKMYRIQHGGVVNADGANRSRLHPTQKPETLMRRIISDWSSPGVILDPFMGSGTTLRAAKDLGRRAIGIEIKERYCEIAARRLGQEVLDLWSEEGAVR
jgi:site-specific DNA-methyltransferase (adenine-specific)